ncbi:DUF1090 domain-containing protein [soil metagenome]
MTRFQRVLCITMLAGASASQAAPPSAACAAKRVSIENEIAYANQHGQRNRLAGLAKALRNNQTHCTDASLRADRAAGIAKAEREVKQREQDLASARGKGDKSKIAARQTKLDAARAELASAQKPLD